MSNFTRLLAVLTACSLSALAFKNTVYVITTAETPSLGRLGLTPVGLQRAQECIPSVFADLNIGKIISCPSDKESGTCFETVTTINPLASSLGLPIDTKCGADENTDDDCVTKLMNKFVKNSTQAILIAWDLSEVDTLLDNINAEAPDGDDDDDDDDDDDETAHHDLIFTVQKNVIISTTSMNCTGIDGPAPGTVRRSEENAVAPFKRRRSSKKSKRSGSKKH